MRYIHQIVAPVLGERWDNVRLMEAFEPRLARLELADDERQKLRDFVRFQLIGERARRSLTDWMSHRTFDEKAAAFEEAVDRATAALAEEIAPAAREAGIQFDAVIATTATGNLMPGISYRLSGRLGDLVRPDSMLLDLANVGCTGSSKALNLARSLDPSFRNILVAAVEVPSTLSNFETAEHDAWQGNCTFGDGAAALWISSDVEQGPGALALEEVQYRQRSDEGLDLIRWQYRDYYRFALRDEKTFDSDVREYVVQALSEAEAGWRDEPRWAIHPAGIVLLVRLSRKLGIPQEAIQPSAAHYREHSNQSSVSVLHVMKSLAEEAPAGAAINLLTMGAGFNVIYGRVRKIR